MLQETRNQYSSNAQTQEPGQSTAQGIKYLWKLPEQPTELVKTIAYTNNLSLPIAHILYMRGYKTQDRLYSFLFPSLEKDVTPAQQLKNAYQAAQRIITAINQNEKILIFGDYDVDGITATALILAALLPLGANINYHLPIRQIEGYGLSSDAVIKAHKNNYSLIITVDNGISAYAAAEKAQNFGIDLIITDHHLPHGNLPYAHAIINPNQADCTYPYKELAGVGVIFKLITLIYEILGIQTLPPKIYELLMLGTVADIAPLTGENRFWVQHGLAVVNKSPSYALKVLAHNNNLTKTILTAQDIGFTIAPQINALGRLSNPRDAVKFLISTERTDVEKIGTILKQMNDERKKLERTIYEEIEQAIINKIINLESEALIFAASKQWASGIIGLVAGKLMQNYGRPTILFHIDETGTAKGSCRSIPEFNIFNALEKNKTLLINFGGHAFAAGLKLSQANLGRLKEQLENELLKTISILDLVPKLTLDTSTELNELNHKCYADLEKLAPFGNQNPQPIFLIKNVTMLKAPTLLKDKHVKCTIFSQGIVKPVIFFNRPDLFNTLLQLQDTPFHMAAYLTKNEWDGATSIELQGLDIASIT